MRNVHPENNRSNPLLPHQLDRYNAWEKLSIDLFGPMPDQRHIIVAQDMVSKFPAAKILKKQQCGKCKQDARRNLHYVWNPYNPPYRQWPAIQFQGI